jgi:hypothetical protein
MNIKHNTITKPDIVEKLFSEKDGVEIRYVCTTEFNNAIVDIFYRETPHPKFGNKYFAIFFRGADGYISDADKVESLTFGMVENDNGQLEYSTSRHDYKAFKNGNMIDGGRAYIRHNGNAKTFIVRNGEMIQHE